MYDRTVDGQAHIFGNTSALYESDMVMFDHATGSYWQQVNGQAIVGDLTGAQLTLLPAQTTTWAQWQSQHPTTQVLSLDTGFQRDYTYDPFLGLGEYLNEGGEFFFPVSELGRDPRLDPGAVVIGVEVAGQQRAYPIELMGDGVVNDDIAGTPVVIFSATNGPTGAAYAATVDGEVYTFTFGDGAYTDDQTGSVWSLAGRAVSGPLAGTQLTPLPVRSTFWFSLITSFPEVELYTGQ